MRFIDPGKRTNSADALLTSFYALDAMEVARISFAHLSEAKTNNRQLRSEQSKVSAGGVNGRTE